MDNENQFIIGLMSGTSLDGVDIVYTRFNFENYADFEILVAETYPYDSEWEYALKEAYVYDVDKLKNLDENYGVYLGNLVNDFIRKYQIEKVDFIASHGHTILHEPLKGITFQIGSGQKIADINHCKVICDFRTQDVQFGGQGAPLVPIGDRLLFKEYDACLNLGGFANVSYEKNGIRIAFDICPVNTVLNFYTQQIGFDYDDEGKLASEGTVNDELLNQLNCLEFYQQGYPKSLGIEWVHQNVFSLIDSFDLDIQDVLRTFVEHITVQISSIIKSKKNVLITGGGAYNMFLINRLKEFCKSKIIIPNSTLIEYKEALIFAFLGLLRNQNKINCLSSVTGAKKDHSSGRIFTPIN